MEGLLNQQELSQILRVHDPDQPSIPHHRQGAAFTRLQSLEGGLSHFGRISGLKIPVHEVGHAPALSLTGQCRHHPGTRQDPCHRTLIQHREILLETGQDV